MRKRNKVTKLSTIIATCIFGLTMTGCSSTGGKTEEDVLDTSNVTLITKVLPYGEVGYALVCDFGEKIDASSLKQEDFKVGVTIEDEMKARTISKIYTNDKIQVSEEPKEGPYLVIELDTEDENASTIVFEEERFLNHRVGTNYTVTQNREIKTEGGKVFKPTEVKNSKIVTPIVEDFKSDTYKDSEGYSIDYRLFEPKTEEGEKYPLVLFLHGSGERGSDNAMHLLGNEGALVWAEPEQQSKNPAYILAPQSPATDELTMYWTEEQNYIPMVNLLKETIEKYNIDENRIYVVGMSNGGIGTWNVIEKNPDIFAAAVPICGIGDVRNFDLEQEYVPLTDYSAFEEIKDMPIWIFHAEDDPLVDVRYSRDAQMAIKELGGSNVKYTEYPEGEVMPMGHFSWVNALQDKEMIDWLFSQSK